MQYGLVSCENTISTVDEYAIVNKGIELNNRSMPKYATVDKNHAFSDVDDTYVVADQEAYDKLNNIVSRKKKHNDGNLYGVTGLCGEDEYDTMKGVLCSNERQTDDLYNTNLHMSNENGDQTYDSSIIV